MMLKKSDSLNSQLGFIVLLIFLFLRPIVTTLEKYSTIQIHLIIPVIFTYGLLFFILLNIRKVKLDKITLVIILYVIFVSISALWGSTYQNVVRITFPFVAFISVRTFADSQAKIRTLYWAIFIAYVPTIFLSSLIIIAGKSIDVVNYYTGFSRQEGLFVNAHALSHSMVIFSFITLYLYLDCMDVKPIYKWLMFTMLILSFYNVYNSYVRNGYLALFIFWSVFTFSYKRKYFLILLLIALIVGIAKYDELATIFWQTDTHNINDASSGRLTLWMHNLELYINQDIFKKIFGWGLFEYHWVIGREDVPWSSHNDYLQLLMEIGLTGLILFMLIIFFLIYDVILLKNTNGLKFVYLSSIITFLAISMVTNGWVLRIECGQLFWSFIGGIYCIRENSGTTCEVESLL